MEVLLLWFLFYPCRPEEYFIHYFTFYNKSIKATQNYKSSARVLTPASLSRPDSKILSESETFYMCGASSSPAPIWWE